MKKQGFTDRTRARKIYEVLDQFGLEPRKISEKLLVSIRAGPTFDLLRLGPSWSGISKL